MRNPATDTNLLPSHRSAWLMIPPPPLFVAAFFAGLALDRVVALRLPVALHAAARDAGIGLLALAALLVPGAVTLFVRHWTTIVPHGTATSMVTSGPYRVTRNPMYLGLTIAYVGVALVCGAVWPLVSLSLPLWVLHEKIIPFEEATLARRFGAEYRAYQQRVRRWI